MNWDKKVWEEAEERRKAWSERREKDRVADDIASLWDEVLKLRDEIEEIQDEEARRQAAWLHDSEGTKSELAEARKDLLSLREVGQKRYFTQ